MQDGLQTPQKGIVTSKSSTPVHCTQTQQCIEICWGMGKGTWSWVPAESTPHSLPTSPIPTDLMVFVEQWPLSATRGCLRGPWHFAESAFFIFPPGVTTPEISAGVKNTAPHCPRCRGETALAWGQAHLGLNPGRFTNTWYRANDLTMQFQFPPLQNGHNVVCVTELQSALNDTIQRIQPNTWSRPCSIHLSSPPLSLTFSLYNLPPTSAG